MKLSSSSFIAATIFIAVFITSQVASAAKSADSSTSELFSVSELVAIGHKFFGQVAGGAAAVIREVVSLYGEPNAYIVGEEAGGSFFCGLRYGEGFLHSRGKQSKLYWQGISIGWESGIYGSRVMMLVYNLQASDRIYQRFLGASGSYYFVGGVSMNTVFAGDIILVPVKAGIGFQSGISMEALHFTPVATWSPL